MRSTKDGRDIGAGSTDKNTSPDFLTLARAAQSAPGRPSANALWRWCRRGVLARGGERVRLRHIRQGGRVYTRIDWLEEFGAALAAADTAHFDARLATPVPARDPAYGPPARRSRSASKVRSADTDLRRREIDDQLDAEGI